MPFDAAGITECSHCFHMLTENLEARTHSCEKNRHLSCYMYVNGGGAALGG